MKQMKRILAYLLVLAMVIAFMPETTFVDAATKDSTYGFHVSGTQLLDANGNPFIMRGVNHAHTWFKDQQNTAMKAIDEAGCNTVRIVLSNGKQWSKDNLSSVKSLVDQCKNYKMIAVLEVHDATGKTDTSDLLAAADYFVEMKDALIGNEAYVIVNIANEWDGTWESSTWKSGYIAAIKKLRNAGIKNTIMVDAAGWGQYPKSIAESGKAVLAADVLGNTMFSTHMYEYAGGSADMVKNNIDSISAQGLCQVIGEFGWKHTDGDVAEETILSYCQQKKIGYMAWSWKGNGGGVEFLDLSNDWAGKSLSDWGDEVVNGVNGIKQTAKECTVFSGQTPATTVPASTTPATTQPTTIPSSQVPVTTTPTVSVAPSQTPVAGSVNLFQGSIAKSSWSNVIELNTVKDGGTFDSSIITKDGYFSAEYTGDKDAVELIFQSWSGGSGWAEVNPSQITTTANGNYLATFNFDVIKASYGEKFTALDRVIVKTTNGSVVLKSLNYVTGKNTPVESVVPTQTVTPVESVEPTKSTEPEETENVPALYSENLFTGSKEVSAWSSALELSTIKNGGSFNLASFNKKSRLEVTYTGTKECLQLIFQSWSGGTGWAVITPSKINVNADGSYTAVFDYNAITTSYGTSFDLLDRIYLQTQNGSITLKSFEFIIFGN